MVIKVYVSRTSGNMEIKRKQEFIHQLLEMKHIQYEEIDITTPENNEHRLFMRENAKPKEGAKNPLPPQVFRDDVYCGDFEAFHGANENECLMEFLKLDSKENEDSTEHNAENAENGEN